MAYICGLGNFGLNQLIITKSGCAGRLGSFVIDASTDYDKPVEEEYCLYKNDGSCGVCIRNCPSEALTFKGIDKPKCNKWLNDNTNKCFGGDRAFKSCGKCFALPCALSKPKMKR